MINVSTGYARVSVAIETAIGTKLFETEVDVTVSGTDEQFQQALLKASQKVAVEHYREAIKNT